MPNWKKVIVSGSEAHLTSVTSSNGVQLADDAFLNHGDGNDLQLYHDGDNSYIKDAGTGGLFYRGGTQTFQNAAGSKTMVVLNAANSVDLNFNDSTKFQTTNTGVSVTGEVVATANVSSSLVSTGSFGDGRFASRLSVGTQESPSLYDAGANTMLVSNAGGNAGITIRSSTSGGGTLHFADGTSGNASYRGVIKYGHSDDDFTFFTAGSSRMKLDSSGVLKDMAGVSGSSTSTGSFGSTQFGGKFELAEQSDTFTLKDIVNSRTYFSATTGAAITIGFGNNADITLDTGTKVVIPRGTGVSGSATSTGSFGSVGVGGNPSLGKLQVNTAAAKRGIVVNATDSNASYMQFTNSSTGTTTGDGLQIGLQSDESAFIALQENSHLAINTNSTERIRITDTGRVGIGTDGPDGMLHVSGSTGDVYFEGYSTSGRFAGVQFVNTANSNGDVVGAVNVDRDGADDAGALTFDTQPAGGGMTEAMRITSTQRVGIGTDDPESQVEIQGSSNSSYAPGTVGLTNTATLFIQNTDNTAAA